MTGRHAQIKDCTSLDVSAVAGHHAMHAALLFSKGLKKDFETAMVNEPSVFEPSKFYCTCKVGKKAMVKNSSIPISC